MTADPIVSESEQPMPRAPSPPPPGREVELKLAVDPADLPALSRLLGPEAPAQRLESVYYDTEGLRLARAGFGLRVRRQGRRQIQTINTQGPAPIGTNGNRRCRTVCPTRQPPIPRRGGC